MFFHKLTFIPTVLLIESAVIANCSDSWACRHLMQSGICFASVFIAWSLPFCIKSLAYREANTFIFDNQFKLVNIVHMGFKSNVETTREQSELKTLEEEILSINLARKEKKLDHSATQT